MIANQAHIDARFQKSKARDPESFALGWRERERFGGITTDPRAAGEIVGDIRRDLDSIEERVRELDRYVPDDTYMGHNDPLGNCLVLLNHIRNAVDDLALRRHEGQFLMFDAPRCGGSGEGRVRGGAS